MLPFITTENELCHSVVLTPETWTLVIAGTEDLSSSRDWLSLPDKDAVGLACHMTLREDFKHKDTGPSLECHEQALPTQQLANPATVGTLAIADVAFQRRT